MTTSSDETGSQAKDSRRLVIVTGMAGAGRRTAAHALEDLGWYVVDNLPPVMLPQLYEHCCAKGIGNIGVILDVRGRKLFEELPWVFNELEEAGQMPEVLFVEASEETIVKRQESVRRPHPLQDDGRLLDGVRQEKQMLSTLRAAADLVIDTTSMNVHQLKSRVSHAYGGDEGDQLRLTVMSFGFKNGLPIDADMVVDVRFLPNPHWVPELRAHTGLTRPVREYVLTQPSAGPFLQQLQSLMVTVAEGYLQEGKRFATLAIGCTGGKHRSTAMAEEIGRRLRELGMPTRVLHRDVGLE
ncbi:RNase adapter RapZ [Propioniferax innocua]|uniref:RNase adapter RapZ n=1 Tax=Propioniferax innocua TaxID=1753 RepID=UPI002482C369|nr:RNase adapter RapZ [Propioniferax innocua]